MKAKKWIDRTLTSVLCIWVGLQYFSAFKAPARQTQTEVTENIITTWKKLKNDNLVHGTILIKKGEKVIFSDGDIQKVYPIASLSKSFVGMAFLQMKKENMKPEVKVCYWLKNFCQGKLSTISIGDLLSHRSGFGRDLSFLHFVRRLIFPEWSIRQIDTLQLSDSDLKHSPGTKFLYSNFGYLVLSRILELGTGKNFEEIVLGLSDSNGLVQTRGIDKGDRFPIYTLVPWTEIKIPIETRNILFRSAGTGGIKSSAPDLMIWLEKIGEQNLSALYEKNISYAHGIVKSRKQSYQAYWHNGAGMGSYSLMAVIPEADIKVVILTDNFKLSKQWSEMAEQFEHYFY